MSIAETTSMDLANRLYSDLNWTSGLLLASFIDYDGGDIAQCRRLSMIVGGRLYLADDFEVQGHSGPMAPLMRLVLSKRLHPVRLAVAFRAFEYAFATKTPIGCWCAAEYEQAIDTALHDSDVYQACEAWARMAGEMFHGLDAAGVAGEAA